MERILLTKTYNFYKQGSYVLRILINLHQRFINHFEHRAQAEIPARLDPNGTPKQTLNPSQKAESCELSPFEYRLSISKNEKVAYKTSPWGRLNLYQKAADTSCVELSAPRSPFEFCHLSSASAADQSERDAPFIPWSSASCAAKLGCYGIHCEE